MKLLSAAQIRNWDAYTITHQNIGSIDLMERAAKECVKWLTARGFEKYPFAVFCGKGNNGGDGLAIARLLIDTGCRVMIYLDGTKEKGSDDFEKNLQKLLEHHIPIHTLKPGAGLPVIEEDVIVIDALFGAGLNRPLSDWGEVLVGHLNTTGNTIISVDLPSGMQIDNSSKTDPVVKASHTLTFQSLKLCLLMPENADRFGEVVVLNIGLDERYLLDIETGYETVPEGMIRSIIRPRNPFSHKGTFGHALLVAGNKGKMGAAILAAKACLRSGIGLLTVNIPESQSHVMHTALPEAMVAAREDNEKALDKFRCIGFGPGAATGEETAALLKQKLSDFSGPFLLDADALTILSRHSEWLALIPEGSVITPHPKEFDRLFGESGDDFARADKAIVLSSQYAFTIVLKGHYTLVAHKGKGWYNTTGNAGLAKGGSGDVLSGIITALLAQQYSALDAALLGVYLHGLAADITLGKQSMESMLATDIIENLGPAFLRVTSGPSIPPR